MKTINVQMELETPANNYTTMFFQIPRAGKNQDKIWVLCNNCLIFIQNTYLMALESMKHESVKEVLTYITYSKC